MDAGASTSLLSSRELEWIGSSRDLAPARMRITCADGRPMEMKGKTDFGSCVRWAEVVVADMGHRGILGMDALKKWGASVDVGLGRVQLNPPHDTEGRRANTPNCLVVGDQVVPGRLIEKIIPVMKDAEVHALCLLEGVPGDDGGEDLRVAPGVGAGTELLHWVRVANWGPDARAIHDGQVVGRWEGVEEQWRAPDGPRGSDTFGSGPERTEAVLQQLEPTLGETLSPGEKEAALGTLQQFARVFKLPGKLMGRTERVQHSIDVRGAVPIRQRLRKVPIHRGAMVEAELARMLADKVIEPSRDPWASPVVLVKKKDRSCSFCVDYRKLNALTRKDAYPLPRMDEILALMRGAEYFSTLDLASGYWQLAVSEEDRVKTAFSSSSK